MKHIPRIKIRTDNNTCIKFPKRFQSGINCYFKRR